VWFWRCVGDRIAACGVERRTMERTALAGASMGVDPPIRPQPASHLPSHPHHHHLSFLRLTPSRFCASIAVVFAFAAL
jgi:hypothetical protein